MLACLLFNFTLYSMVPRLVIIIDVNNVINMLLFYMRQSRYRLIFRLVIILYVNNVIYCKENVHVK